MRRTIDVRRDEPWLVGCRLTADVRLLDLVWLWPTRAGASAAISGGPRPAERIGHLTVGQVYAALAYYHANREEIDADLAAEEALLMDLESSHGAHDDS